MFRQWQTVIQICVDTEEQLTSWMCIQPFPSMVPFYSNTGEQLTAWICVQPILVSGSYLLKHWGTTHLLDVCSAIVIICFLSAQTLDSNSLAGCIFSPSRQCFWYAQHWRVTHKLKVCSDILISGSHLLTFWMYVQPYLWHCTLGSDSHTECVFSHSH